MTIGTHRNPGTEPPVEMLGGASLFLDFDGTLVEIVPRPDAVEVTAELRDLLTLLSERLGGRLAILSGRSASHLEEMLHPLMLAIGGHHGLETRAAGTVLRSAERPPVMDSIVEQLRPLEEAHPGVFIEDKPLGIAVHYRQAPDAENACRDAVTSIAERSGLELQPGKMVFELKARGSNKGDALRRLMQEPPFAGTRPVFLGDDLTDEPGFEAAQALGGSGILIGEREPTAARYRLAGVDSVLDWLHRAAERAA